MTLKRPLLWGASLVVLAVGTLPAFVQTAQLPADSRARLPYVQRKNLDEAGQKIFDVLPGRSADGALGGPLAFAAYNPAVAKALFDAAQPAEVAPGQDHQEGENPGRPLPVLLPFSVDEPVDQEEAK